MTNRISQFWTIIHTVLLGALLGACGQSQAPTSHDGGPAAPSVVGSDGGTSEFATRCADFCIAHPRSLDDCSAESVEDCRATCVARLTAAPHPNDLCLECLLEDAYFGGQRIVLPPTCNPSLECTGELCSYRGCDYCKSDYGAEAACREATRETVECDLDFGPIRDCAELCG
ncbi:MAG: hypothetical protein JJ863_24615 [Deltaproteobacteria bacterium]|nr:hypothetical protein [Deltaproteobacteria bacterium]